MVHMIDTTRIDLNILTMIYNILSHHEKTLFLIADNPFAVPKWDEISKRARYFFPGHVHLISAAPYTLRIEKHELYNSVNIVMHCRANSFFTPLSKITDLHPTTLKSATTRVIQGTYSDQFYKSRLNVDDVTEFFPFSSKSTLLDTDLKLYDDMSSRIGDL